MSQESTTPACPSCQERDRRIAELEQTVADLRRQLDAVQRQLEAAQQQGKRQAAPFRRNKLPGQPRKPGRPHGHPRAARPLPARVDCNRTVSGAVVHMVLASLMASLRQQGKRFVDLALPLWRSVRPAALEVEAPPKVVERELEQDWLELSVGSIWPVPLAASG